MLGSEEFARLTEPFRPELLAHCYRMLGSVYDAEDQVQETLVRAWRSYSDFQGRSSLRTWLYRIATNACLRAIENRARRPLPSGLGAPGDDPDGALAPVLPEIRWLQPIPDALIRPGPADPAAVAVSRESVRLALIAALQYLPGRQRAVLILRDVLGWPAKDVAELLGDSVNSVNSALQRARETLRKHQPQLRPEWKPGADPNEQQRAFLTRYVTATERGDVAGLTALLQEDVRFSMPPEPGLYAGRDNVVAGWLKGGFGADWFGTFRCQLTRANRMPAIACYLRKPGATSFRALALDVLEIEEGLIKEITTFSLEDRTGLFDLPPELP